MHRVLAVKAREHDDELAKIDECQCSTRQYPPDLTVLLFVRVS